MISKKMTFNIETKWNADNEKMTILLNLEDQITQALMEYDYGRIYSLLRVYRLNADPKFSNKEQPKLEEEMDKLTNSFLRLQKDNSDINKSTFVLLAENFFLKISRGLKGAGIYFREGRNANNAILER